MRNVRTSTFSEGRRHWTGSVSREPHSYGGKGKEEEEEEVSL